MPSAADIRAGRAFVEMYTENGPLYAGLTHAQWRVQQFAKSSLSIGMSLARSIGAVAAPLAIGIRAASDMEETMNKFNVVFGENANRVKAWADEYAGQVGRSKQQVADFLASSQDLFVPMGFDAESAESISKTLASLAVDLASFNNMADGDVLRDLQAAMTGSGEVMKKYGVILSEAAVKQELLNMGMDPKAATDAQKAQARMNIIMRGTTAAQGDAIRSSGSFANQMKALKAAAWDAAGAIGSAILPTVTELVKRFVGTAKAVGDFIARNEGLVVAFSAIVAVGGAVAGGLIAVGIAASGLASALGFLATAMTFVAAHPLMILATGLAVAAAALIYFESTARRLPGTIGEVRKKSDEMRASDRKLMEELTGLAEKQGLTNEEMDRAATILDTLEGRYGNLGVTIDRTQGTINGMADAQNRLNEAMSRATIAQLTAEMKSVEVEITELEKKREGFWRQVMQGFGSDYDQVLLDKIMAEYARLDALRQRIDAIKGGDVDALTDGAQVDAAPDPVTVAIEAGDTEAALEMNEQMLDRIADLRIERIEDEQERAIAAINKRYDAEREKAKELGADLALVEEARNKALENAESEFQRRQGEEAAHTAEMKRISNQRLQDEIDAMQIRKDFTDKSEQQVQLLELQRRQALRDAGDTGADEATINEYFDMKLEMLDKAREAVIEAQRAESHSLGSAGFAKVVLETQIARNAIVKSYDEHARPASKLEEPNSQAAVAAVSKTQDDVPGLLKSLLGTTRNQAADIAELKRKIGLKEAVSPKR